MKAIAEANQKRKNEAAAQQKRLQNKLNKNQAEQAARSLRALQKIETDKKQKEADAIKRAERQGTDIYSAQTAETKSIENKILGRIKRINPHIVSIKNIGKLTPAELSRLPEKNQSFIKQKIEQRRRSVSNILPSKNPVDNQRRMSIGGKFNRTHKKRKSNRKYKTMKHQ